MMILLKTIARPYAKAAFYFALDSNSLGEWSDFLKEASIVVSDKNILKVLNNPNIKPEQFLELFLSILLTKIDVNRQYFLSMLTQQKRLNILSEIYQLFCELLSEYESTMDVQVTSAFGLDEKQEERLKKVLKERLSKKDIKIYYTIDKAILGGAIIKVGDLIIDGSCRNKLYKLEEYLKEKVLL